MEQLLERIFDVQRANKLNGRWLPCDDLANFFFLNRARAKLTGKLTKKIHALFLVNIEIKEKVR